MYVLNTDHREQKLSTYNTVNSSSLTLKLMVYIVLSQSLSEIMWVFKEASKYLQCSHSSSDTGSTAVPANTALSTAQLTCSRSLQPLQCHLHTFPHCAATMHISMLHSIMITTWFSNTLMIQKIQKLPWWTICSYGNSDTSDNFLNNCWVGI